MRSMFKAVLLVVTMTVALPTAARAEEDRIAPEAIRADFADLYRLLSESHYDLDARAPRAGYDRLFARMRDEIRGPMSRAGAAAFFQRFMAFGRVAHARIDAAGAPYAAYREGGGRAFPLAIRMNGGRLFVVGNGSGFDSIAVGDEIVALNGMTVAQWLDTARRQISADTPYMLGAMLEWALPQILWSALGPVDHFELRLRRPGRVFSVSAPARSRTEMMAALEDQPARLELSWQGREARMLDHDIAYLRPGPSYNVDGGPENIYDNSAYKAFIDQAFERFLAADATALIVDLRDNPGGDNSFSDHLIAWFANRPFRFNSRFRIRVSEATRESNRKRIDAAANDPTGIGTQLAAAYARAADGDIIDFPTPEMQPHQGARFSGRVYALVNRHSYSNTVTMASIVQDYGFGRILGEETSDLATTYGAMESFRLPHTGIDVGYPKAHIVRPNGDLSPRGVVPDIAIPTPVVETPDDPVLRRTIEIVRDENDDT